MAAKSAPGMDCTYEEMRRDTCIVDVEGSLFAEQGGICAYTGHRLRLQKANPETNATRTVGFHIEHLRPQEHCDYGQDAEYNNMVACWPRPNCGFEPDYGARKKDDWPSPHEEELFLSPLREDCSNRFTFNHRGEIAPTAGSDQPAKTTIEKLGLNNPKLVELRRAAIRGAFHPKGKPIRLNQALRLRDQYDEIFQILDAGGKVSLNAFCFAIRSALDREIRKLEGIRRSR